MTVYIYKIINTQYKTQKLNYLKSYISLTNSLTKPKYQLNKDNPKTTIDRTFWSFQEKICFKWGGGPK